MNDSEGICQRLDEDVQAVADAYVDPWKEAEMPFNPTQSASMFNGVRPVNVSDVAK